MTKLDIPEIIRRRYRKASELLSPITAGVEVNRNLYRGKLDIDDTYEWDYSLTDPHVFPLVRNYLSRSNPTMSNIKLDPRKPSDYEKKDANQQFLNWEVGELMLTSLFYRVFFSSYLAGKGYLQTGWKYEKAVKIEVKDKNGKIERTQTMKEITNRAYAEFVRFNDILVPNRNEPNLYKQPYIIQLIQKQVGEMVDENEQLENEDKKPYWKKAWLKKLKEAGVRTKLLDYQIEMVDDAEEIDDMAYRSAYVSLMCMKTIDGEEYYLPLEDGEEGVVNTSTDSKFWHGHYDIIDFTPFPEDDDFYPMALVDVVGDLQIAATEILNQTLTNIRQINNDMWIAGTAAAQTPDWQFKRRPDGIIRVSGDAQQIQNVRTQDNTMSALRMGDSVTTKIERSGGISSLYSSGAPSQNINQTARGAQIIDQNIDTNMKMIQDLFGEQVVKRVGEHFLELNAQFVTEDQIFFITGKKGMREFITMSPEVISANFDVIVNAERMIKQTPASRQASLQNTIQVLQNIQVQSQGAIQVDLTPAVEALVDATPDMENVDDIIVSLDEKGERDVLMLERGQMPEIKVKDPHKELVMYANVWFEEHQSTYAPEVKDMFEKYAEKHIKFIQSAAEIQAMAAPQLPQPMGAPGLEQQMSQVQGQTEGLPGGGYNLGGIVG